jgi:hypothetical protein
MCPLKVLLNVGQTSNFSIVYIFALPKECITGFGRMFIYNCDSMKWWTGKIIVSCHRSLGSVPLMGFVVVRVVQVFISLAILGASLTACVTCSQRYYLSHNTALVKLLKRLGHRSVPQWLKDDLSDTVTAWHHSRIIARCLIGTEGLVSDWQRYVHSLASLFWSSSCMDIKMTFSGRWVFGPISAHWRKSASVVCYFLACQTASKFCSPAVSLCFVCPWKLCQYEELY